MLDTKTILTQAGKKGILVPAFNVAHLPMTEPILEAVKDTDSFALVEVSRVDWEKFGAESYGDVIKEYNKYAVGDYSRIHLDHVPVVDEDGQSVDYSFIMEEALKMGYQSVMIDGSRLSLEDNIRVTREMADLAHSYGIPIEAELGAVLGHEAGPPPPYEELFSTGKGFTKVDEAIRFVKESRCDFLSVAIGNIHGAISDSLKDRKKPEARLNIDHLKKLWDVTGTVLVLHGGSGVKREYLLEAGKNGITKVNVGTEIRQAYESAMKDGGDVKKAQKATYDSVRSLITDHFSIAGSRPELFT